MLVLFETPSGYAIFKLLNENILKNVENLYEEFESPEAAGKLLKLKHFEKFNDTNEALAATKAAVEGKVSKTLKKVIKKYVDVGMQDKLLVADSSLGTAIKKKFSLQCLSNSPVQELMRCIRQQLDSLIASLPKKDVSAMALGLAHSLSRYKLKFSPDKVDTMIVQAVSVLDDLDKELNNYMMRCREWYGWHFPELGKIVTDNIMYVKVIKVIGTRDNTATSDLSDILPEEVEQQVKEAAEVSMGTDISDDDIVNIHGLCDQIINDSSARDTLYDYLKSRMMAMAPNLTTLVGELVGAKLIAHSGSLINLAKQPASTVQILGAEKALFRALKTKKDTPKYGIIYHTQLVGQSSTRNKGKMSRMLAAKASLAVRFDALGESDNYDLGAEHKVKLEARLRLLEEGNVRRISGTAKARAKFEKYQGKSDAGSYPAAADSTLPSGSKRKRAEEEEVEAEAEPETPKQKKKKAKKEVAEETLDDVKQEDGGGEGESSKKKKKKKAKQVLSEEAEVKTEDDGVEKKKKKKKRASESEVAVEEVPEPTPEKKKKKKKKAAEEDE